MTRFDRFIEIVFENEGFISDNKNDSGGLTKFGISKMAYPDIDIRNLTREQAKYIYKRDYYDRCQIDKIKSDLLALHVFDMSVNAGVSRAIKILQRIVGVSQDGIIGVKTLKRANSIDYSQSYIDARIFYYKSIATGRNSVFLKGWLNRVNNTTNSCK